MDAMLIRALIRAYNFLCITWAVFICIRRAGSKNVPFIKQHIAVLKYFLPVFK